MQRHAGQVYDEWLVLRAQDADREALAELVARWHPRLVGYALGLTGEEALARDAVQAAWLAAGRGIGRLDDPARFPAWICRIVSNKCADAIRRASRDRASARALARDKPAGTSNPSALASDSEETARVRGALARLGAAQRELLSLHYGSGLGVHDLASMLGVPMGTIKSRLHAARNELRAILERNMS